MSAGMSTVSQTLPSSPFQRWAFISIRSTTPVKSPSRPIGIWSTSGVGLEPVDDRLDIGVEVGAGAVELVDEADPRNLVAVGLAPDRFGLRLDSGDAVEDGDGSVENPQAPLDLDGEVDVTGGVDDVDGVVVPDAGGGGRGDGDPPLLLLLHPVHRGCAFVDFADLVVATRVIEDALGQGGLARVDVSHDPDISGSAQGHLSQVRERVLVVAHFVVLLRVVS